ncbi:hypothetical protein GF374_02845 [Candidatus Woesearchaeota archaeon]|nr:hypothetical protein [Candidatus Woesearchaeota archaeon]
MFKSKKGIFAFAVVLVIMIAFGAILVGIGSQKKVYAEIGGKQINMLNAYSEAEKTHEYVKFSALHSAAITAQELNAKTGTKCFSNVNKATFQNKFKDKMDLYLQNYKSTNIDLNVSELNYNYEYSIKPDKITIDCFAQPNITIKSRKIDFTYSTQGYVKAELTCEDYTNYAKTKSFVV